MKKRFTLICRGSRGGAFYCFDSLTKKRESLNTKVRDEAERLVQAQNEAWQQVVHHSFVHISRGGTRLSIFGWLSPAGIRFGGSSRPGG
jgi:hypothetical protein